MARPLGPLTPLVDATAGVASAAVFGTASALRRARVFHPTGSAFEATFVVERAPVPATGGTLFDEPGERPALVRLSRGAGVPEPLPDIFGLAVRVPHAYGPGAHQDLLVNTAGGGFGRFTFVPRRGHGDGQHSSVLPYRVGGRIVLLGASTLRSGPPPAREADLATAVAAGNLRYRLELADAPFGMWKGVATIRLGAPMAEAEAESLRFNPVEHTGGGIEPIGFFQTLRRLAYRGSQATRPHPGD